jgi:hypothetical protein
MKASRKKAHANPNAQYTLVSIKGKNSIDASPPILGTGGSEHSGLSGNRHGRCAKGGAEKEFERAAKTGNNVTKS